MNPRTIHQWRAGVRAGVGVGGTQQRSERTQWSELAQWRVKRTQRRGSIVLLAIVVLALLFIIGITSLMVATDSRKSAEVAIQARQERMIHEAMTQHAMMQLRPAVAK